MKNFRFKKLFERWFAPVRVAIFSEAWPLKFIRRRGGRFETKVIVIRSASIKETFANNLQRHVINLPTQYVQWRDYTGHSNPSPRDARIPRTRDVSRITKSSWTVFKEKKKRKKERKEEKKVKSKKKVEAEWVSKKRTTKCHLRISYAILTRGINELLLLLLNNDSIYQ